MRPGSRIRLNQGESDPPKVISHILMTVGMGICQKKKGKKFLTPPNLVTLLWNDPYIHSFVFQG